MVNRVAASNISLALKTTGIVCILSFFLDFVVLMMDFSISNKQAQINLATSLVDRGIVPLIGLVLLLTAYWVDQIDAGNDRLKGVDLRLPAFFLSSFLGVMFLIISPWHVNNVVQARTQAVDQIAKDAQQAENQINNQLAQFESQLNSEQGKAQLQQLRAQAKAQVTELIKDDKKYQQVLDNPQTSAEQKDSLKKLKANPQDIDKFIAQKTDPKEQANQKQTQIRQHRDEVKKQAEQGALKSGFRVSVTSLLYAVAYSIIGWTGLMGLGIFAGSKRKVPVR